MDAMIGRTLGKYQIVEQLGEGGMATVYKAFDSSLERYVAIKVIRLSNQVDPYFLARFQREAKALAQLDHPYILKVLDYGEENGIPFLVMPFIAHGTLKQYTHSPLPYEKAIKIVLPIAEALSYAHKRKIIHRDIKPANILFGESGEPILSDFGIAKILDTGGDQTQLTGVGLGVGTPAYMAPEQWNGIADERTDIYSLGIVLYELLTSRCPFQADTPAAILIKQVQDPLPRPKIFVTDIPENIEAVIFKALAKDPTMRFQTMQDFINAMNNVLQDKATVFFSPSSISEELDVTQVAYRPPQFTPAPIMMNNHPTQKKKWIPFAIVGGALIAMVWIIFLVSSVSKNGFLNFKKSTEAVEAFTQETIDNNNQENTQIGLGNAGIQSDLSPTKDTIGIDHSIASIENLPEDIPVYIPNNGDVTTTTAEGTLMFSYSTNAEKKIVVDYFLTEMNNQNWNLITTSEMSAQNMIMWSFEKDSRNIMIYVIGDQMEHTYIQIMIPVQR
ncbi:MAG TPA: hypothetical protein DIW44_10860 [Anaerolineaceae bacterium]|nr:hypothetical protein [Anaerolineaceae bacterium]